MTERLRLETAQAQLVEKGHFSVAFFSSYHPTCSKMYVG